MKRKIFSILFTLVLVVSLTLVPFAGTVAANDEVKAAIEKGVAWLLDQQNLLDPEGPQYGSWGDWEKVAVTAFAVKKLEHYAINKKYGLELDSPFDAPYAAQLEAGLNFLFANAHVITIGTQTHDATIDDPDTDGDGKGVHFGAWSRTYTTGIVLMAIAETTTPDREVDVEDSDVDGWTYEEVAQDTLDYLAWGQTDGGTGRGGWIYNEMDNASGWSDNSNTGYAVLGLQYAQAPPPDGFGLTIPLFVKDELKVWINYIQCNVSGPNYGGSGYSSPCDWVNILKTGNLLKELKFVGATTADPRVQNALSYLHLHWDDPTYSSSGFHGWRADKGVDDDGDGFIDEDPINWFDDDGDGLVDEDPGIPTSNYQAMYTTMKGLTSLGIQEFCDPPIDWQADFETVLLAEQNPDGSWPKTFWDYGTKPILSTLWALLTLEKVVPPRDVPVDIKPQSCPNPLNVKSKGVLPVAILGTADFDVTQVDVTTVLLEGVSPLRWDLEDVATPFEPFIGKEACDDCTDEGPDGYLDLTLKFDKQEIVAALDEVEDGQCVVLRLTGNLKEEFHGKPIVGEDVVLILKKGGGGG